MSDTVSRRSLLASAGASIAAQSAAQQPVNPNEFTYVRWLNGAEELYDNAADPFQMRNLWGRPARPGCDGEDVRHLSDLLHESHDDFHPAQNTPSGSRRDAVA